MNHQELINSMTVLYVEDDNKLLREVLEESKFDISNMFANIISANNGQEGYDKFVKYQNEIDLIISDIQMPLLNGIEMVRLIKKIDKKIPVILTSKFSNPEYVEQSINLGIDAYVNKPIDVKKFHKAIDRAVLKIEASEYQHELEETNEILSLMYTTDKMTGLDNRKSFFAKALKLYHKCQMRDVPLVSIVFSINAIDIIDKEFSSDKGDEVITTFSEILQHKLDVHNIKSIYGRINGNEFVVLLDNISYEEAEALSLQIQNLAHQKTINLEDNKTFHFDVVFGISQLKSDESLDEFLVRADNQKNETLGKENAKKEFRTRS
jgi:diguanylate cyclase (GGDEF)-like protein